jgi:hypothetical protein
LALSRGNLSLPYLYDRVALHVGARQQPPLIPYTLSQVSNFPEKLRDSTAIFLMFGFQTESSQVFEKGTAPASHPHPPHKKKAPLLLK